MGNNQSTVGHHNRLSKPRTNTNSPGQAPATESPASIKSRYTEWSAKGRHHVQETPTSPLETENGWSAKDEDLVSALAPRPRGRPLSVISRSNSRANSRTNSKTNSRSNSLSCFGSRHGSTTKLADLHGSKLSLNGQVDLDAAIRLLQEVKKNGSPEDLAALHEALDSSADPALPIVNGPILSRRTSSTNGSISSLTRRRSLVQTPGVATRNSPVEGRRRTWNSWKAPQIAPEEEAKWAVTSKGITPLNRQSVSGAASTSPRCSSPRAQTPSEMDYSQLGSLQLGTLSIVNGAPSPAASTRMLVRGSQPREEVDYFTPAELGSSPLAMKTKRRHGRSKSTSVPATAPLYSVETQRTTLPARPRTQHSNPHVDSTDSRSGPPHSSETAKTFRITNGSVHSDDSDARKYAQDYQAYIPYSPFVQKFPTAETDKNHSKRDDPSPRDEAAQVLAGTMFDAPTTATEGSGSVLFSPTVPRVEVSEDQPRKSIIRPSPRTIDSGYSSGGSLTDRGRRSDDSGRSHRKEDGAAMHIPERLERPSTSESLRSPISPCSVASKSSTDSTRSSSQKRLQRRRPSQPELPVIQSCQSIPEGTIPDIPVNVRAKFTRRLSHTPDMECLTKTFPSKDHVIIPEAPAELAETKPAEIFTQLAELEPERQPTAPVHGRHRSLSLFRRKSNVEKAADEEGVDGSFGVVDLGTIASSLGSSPYDAAMSGQQRKPVTSPTHPHQLGGTLPRAKSMVSMNSEAAAEFARLRSRDRALMESQMPQQRRRSFHNLKIDVGEAKAMKRRSQILQGDIPPVPAMPAMHASMLKAPLSAMPRLEREPEQKVAGTSFIPRCQPKGEVVSQVVYRYEQQEQQEQKAPVHTLEWDEHARHWNHRRKSIGEGLRARASFTEASASTINSRNNPVPRVDMAAWGRYSGGLEYNYEGRSLGVGGSAGTRSYHSTASSKSMQWRDQYGVDFSDVPIFLQRA